MSYFWSSKAIHDNPFTIMTFKSNPDIFRAARFGFVALNNFLEESSLGITGPAGCFSRNTLKPFKSSFGNLNTLQKIQTLFVSFVKLKHLSGHCFHSCSNKTNGNVGS